MVTNIYHTVAVVPQAIIICYLPDILCIHFKVSGQSESNSSDTPKYLAIWLPLIVIVIISVTIIVVMITVCILLKHRYQSKWYTVIRV